MRITSIAIASLQRRKGKFFFLVFGIAIAVGTVIALMVLNGSLRQELGDQLDRFGANILIVPESDNLSLDYGGVSVSDVSFDVQRLTTKDVAAVGAIPYRQRLSVIAPKVITSVAIGERRVFLAGVELKHELRLKPWWRIAGQQPKADAEVLLGHSVAEALGVVKAKPGQPANSTSDDPHAAHGAATTGISLISEQVVIAGVPHRVTGVLEPTGGPEDRLIFADLKHVQNVMSLGDRVDVIEVSALCKDCPIGDIVAQIQTALPNAKVSAIQQAVRAREHTVESVGRFGLAVGVIVLVIAILMIFTTMMGSVTERTREIGVFRALGFRKLHILQQFTIEVMLVSVLGACFGWSIGITAARIALPYFTESPTMWSGALEAFMPALFLSVAIGILGSIYPALRASRLDPSEAIRSI
jgi:putative ABC transport system permease protein